MHFDTTDPSESDGARSDTITDDPEPEMQMTKYTEAGTRTPGWEMKAEWVRRHARENGQGDSAKNILTENKATGIVERVISNWD